MSSMSVMGSSCFSQCCSRAKATYTSSIKTVLSSICYKLLVQQEKQQVGSVLGNLQAGCCKCLTTLKGRAEQGTARVSRAGQGRAGQGRAGQGRAGQGSKMPSHSH